MYDFPPDRWYDGASHMWARLDSATGRVVVGIDTLGLAALGDLAYISLQALGAMVKRGEGIGVFEAAKMTSDIVTPVSGTLVERNEQALHDPLLVNSDPYGRGWLAAIEPIGWEDESVALIAGDAVAAWAEAEIGRYRSEGWID